MKLNYTSVHIILFLLSFILFLSAILYTPSFFYDLAQSLSADGVCSSCHIEHFLLFRTFLYSLAFLSFFISILFYFCYNTIIENIKKLIQLFFTSKNLWFLLFSIGIILRFGLFLTTPPTMGYDNHIEEILFIYENGVLPLPNECWECFHPPLYYLIGATGLQLFIPILSISFYWKLLQFFSFSLSIATIYLIWRMLLLLFSSNKIRILCFSIAVFLPRSIYTGIMLSNDALSIFFLTLFYYFLILYHKTKSNKLFFAVCFTACFGIVTKLSLLFIVPFFSLYLIFFEKQFTKKIITLFIFFLFVFFSLGPFLYNNYVHYGTLIVGPELFFEHTAGPYYTGIESITSFHFVHLLFHPIIHPTTETSFFTSIFADSWYDFNTVYVLVNSINYIFAPFIYILALVPTLFFIFGLISSFFSSKDEMNYIFLFTFLFHIIFLITYFILTPVYSVKASYLLGSMITILYFFGRGWIFIFSGRLLFKNYENYATIGLIALYGTIIIHFIVLMCSLVF